MIFSNTPIKWPKLEYLLEKNDGVVFVFESMIKDRYMRQKQRASMRRGYRKMRIAGKPIVRIELSPPNRQAKTRPNIKTEKRIIYCWEDKRKLALKRYFNLFPEDNQPTRKTNALLAVMNDYYTKSKSKYTKQYKNTTHHNYLPPSKH